MNKLPPLKIRESGLAYANDLLGHQICTGARTGIPERLPFADEAPLKLRMVLLPLTVGGYAPNGAYMGVPQPGHRRYHVESVEQVLIRPLSHWVAADQGPFVATVRLFPTAANRRECKELVRRQIPNATFYR